MISTTNKIKHKLVFTLRFSSKYIRLDLVSLLVIAQHLLIVHCLVVILN